MPSLFEMGCNRVQASTLTICVKKQKFPETEIDTEICSFQVSSLYSLDQIFFPNVACSILKQKTAPGAG